MTATTRRFVVCGLVALSVLCAVGFACMLGSILHAGSQAVARGPETATFPSSTGWVATVLMLVGTWLGGSWAKWFATAAKAVPVVTQVIDGIQQSQSPKPKPDEPKPETTVIDATAFNMPETSHEFLLSALLQTLEIAEGKPVHSEGKHSLDGGTISWVVDFTPGHELKAAIPEQSAA